MLVGGSFHGDFRVCIVVFRPHKYEGCLACYADLTHSMKGLRVEGEEGTVSPMAWTPCGIRLESLCLSCLCV